MPVTNATPTTRRCDDDGQPGHDRVAPAPPPSPLGPSHRPGDDRLMPQPTSQILGKLLARRSSGSRVPSEGISGRSSPSPSETLLSSSLGLSGSLSRMTSASRASPVASEGPLPDKHLVEHYPQRPLVAAGIRQMASSGVLLGAHVGRRADEHSRLGPQLLPFVPPRHAESPSPVARPEASIMTLAGFTSR